MSLRRIFKLASLMVVLGISGWLLRPPDGDEMRREGSESIEASAGRPDYAYVIKFAPGEASRTKTLFSSRTFIAAFP